MNILIAAIAWCAMMPAGGVGLHPVSQPQHNLLGVGPSSQSCPGDTAAVVRYLTTNGYQRFAIEARWGSYFAVLAGKDTLSPRELLGVRVGSHGVELLLRLSDMGEVAPTSIQWFGLLGQTVDGLAITFDNRAEGVVGTVLFSLLDGALMRTFGDAAGVCQPAELADLDGDGELELITYVEDPSNGHCSNPCHFELMRRFGMTPSWPRIHRWRRSAWVPADSGYAEFYRPTADAYERVDRWLAADPDSGICRGVYWLTDTSLFRNWAVRARNLAR